MTEGKLEKIILYIVVLVLLVSLFTVIFIMNQPFSIVNINSEIWSPLSTFVGALLGAGISGSIAIYVMRRDISSRTEEKIKELNDNYKKSFELISMWSGSFLQSFESINMLVQLEDGSKKNSLEIELYAIEECKTRLGNINDDYIPQIVYKDFLDLKALIDFTYHIYQAYTSKIEITKHQGKLLIFSEDEAVKQWTINSYQGNKRRFTKHLNVLQQYKDQLK